MYTVLGDIIRKSEPLRNLENAVLYECICCASSIFPNKKLLDAVVEATSKFRKSDSHNLKYMGIDALGRLIKINTDITEEHQLAVINCLEDPDDTLERKTFELLYKMTKSTNVEVIVDRMINYMTSINDSHYKTEIASRCVELAEQFTPSNHWFIQTMNKVFEHAGDLVNTRVAHNLMRLIAEGFGEDDEGTDGQLRSSAVESYLRILGEPKLPSLFLQVICWVLGEYGTADGKYSASYVIGKLCDTADAHSDDDAVKAYAITAIMKLWSFEIAARRKLEMLPECQSLIDELSASHSTDLQQRAYELQALLRLDVRAVESAMPSDASCEDIEVDKSLSFLNSFVQQSLENGARPYIPEGDRSGMVNVGNFKSQYQNEASNHGLRFEAYELPKPSPPTQVPQVPRHPPTTDLVPVPESSYVKETHGVRDAPDALTADLGSRLRLDGVQKKWGRPYSSPSASSSSTDSSQKSSNGVAHVHNNYTSRSEEVEVLAEKQRLAASLFGASSSKHEKKPSGHRLPKGKSASSEKPAASSEPLAERASPSSPPPDLLDLSEQGPVNTPSIDPFEQLEGLLAPGLTPPPAVGPRAPDLVALYTDASTVSDNGGMNTVTSDAHAVKRNVSVMKKKGPQSQASLERDATARQVGVTPTVNNPNLFRDLLG